MSPAVLTADATAARHRFLVEALALADSSSLTDEIGKRVRHWRRRAALTLDELAIVTAISKPYLSLIETARVPNPPSDSKLARIELAIGLPHGQLVALAEVHRTPQAVRDLLAALLLGEGTVTP